MMMFNGMRTSIDNKPFLIIQEAIMLLMLRKNANCEIFKYVFFLPITDATPRYFQSKNMLTNICNGADQRMFK